MIIEHKPLIILGNGGHAKVLLEILTDNNEKLLGTISNEKIDKQKNLPNIKWLGNDDDLKKYGVDEIKIVNGIGFVPGQRKRIEIFEMLKKQKYLFKKIYHPSSFISKSTEVAEGVQILSNAVISTGVSIGENTIINTGSIIDHDCIIERNCHVATGVTCSGNVHIHEGSFIGAGSVIINGITIGKNCIVAAGSVVYKDLPDNTKYVSNNK